MTGLQSAFCHSFMTLKRMTLFAELAKVQQQQTWWCHVAWASCSERVISSRANVSESAACMPTFRVTNSQDAFPGKLTNHSGAHADLPRHYPPLGLLSRVRGGNIHTLMH